MSVDEFIALCASLFFIFATWIRWLWTAVSIDAYHQPRTAHIIVWAAGAGAAVLLLFVLRRWASWDVRDSLLYTSFYLIMGAGFTGATLLLLDRTGLSLRDDAFERFNPAAAIAGAGAILGSTAAFAGANIGDGPGWWVVVFCALMSNGAMLAGWFVLDRAAGIGDAITIDRDAAAAWRAAGWFTASGIIFGRAAGGNWTGIEVAIRDFLDVAAGGLVLLCGAVALERLLRSGRTQRDPLFFGGVLAGIYLCGAIAYITLRHPL